MKSETFYEVLKTEVRNDLLRELESEILARRELKSSPQLRAATSQHEYLGTWLATHLSARLTHSRPKANRQSNAGASAKTAEHPPDQDLGPKSERFSQPSSDHLSGQKTYSADGLRPEIKTETKHQASSTDEQVAFQILQTVLQESGTYLPAQFTMSELKRCWKTAALKTHPDRHPFANAREVAFLNERFTALLSAVNVLLSCKPL